MQKRLLMVLVYLLLGSFLIGLNLPQERNIKIVAKTADGKPLPLYNASYALVVGVANYINGWPKLDEAVNDTRQVEATLVQHGFVVKLVKDPTAVQLREAIENFLSTYGLDKETRLLFYFSGHGYTQTFDYGGEMGYIVPSDAPLPNKDPAGFLRKAISMESFSSYARNFNAKHGLFLFDSCFSGSIFALSRALPDAITYKTSEPVRQFITAGAANETVPDKSIFKQQFLAALTGEGDANHDGYVTGNELGEFLQTNVANYSRNTQHPQYGKIRDQYLDKGDFVFVVPLALPPKEKLDLSAYENEAKAQWDKWQKKMNAFYQRAQTLDRDANLAADSKAKMWQDFLAGYVNDNPYSNDDETMRREASSRQSYWRSYQPPKDEPAPARPVNDDDEMVLIPAGSFIMGSNDGYDDDEEPEHSVSVDAFYMDKYEVSVAKYKKFLEATNYQKPGNWTEQLESQNNPVVAVSWNDAKSYCDWLSKIRGKPVRLPTEAEWEYAARGGLKGKKYPLGDNIDATKANYDWDGNRSGGWESAKHYLKDIDSFPPNDFGLFNMVGNVWEWCNSVYKPYPYKRDDDRENSTAFVLRVVRGGSWGDSPAVLRCAVRSKADPADGYNNAGFRCAQDVR